MGDIIEKNITDPFKTIIEQVKEVKNNGADYIFLDFHAEATAEKIAMGHYLTGIVTCVFGTHTHVQTADEKILDNKTAYITDIGMTGPKNSVIGMEIKASLKRFETSLPERYKLADGNCTFNGCLFEINDSNCHVEKIKRLNFN